MEAVFASDQKLPAKLLRKKFNGNSCRSFYEGNFSCGVREEFLN